MSIPTEIQRVNAGDAEIHVEITGKGPDLFLVAGLGGRGIFWANQVQEFAKHFRVISHDHRGCGKSSPGKLVDGAEHIADDLIALMDTMGTYLAMPSTHLQPQMKNSQEFMEERMAAFPGMDVELSRLDAVINHDLRDHLHKITHQTLCIGAKDDQITRPAYTEELGQKIPSAETHLLERGGHFCPIASADIYTARVLQFLMQ